MISDLTQVMQQMHKETGAELGKNNLCTCQLLNQNFPFLSLIEYYVNTFQVAVENNLVMQFTR